MRIIALVCLVAITVFLTSCVTVSKLNKIDVGMTEEEVIKKMGKPLYSSAQNSVKFLNYSLSTDGFYFDDYFVRLIDGKVESYGRDGDFDSTKESTQTVNINKRVLVGDERK